jgi:putative endonuclease
MLKNIEMQEEKKAYVYILSNDRRNVLYIGSTAEFKKRIYLHKKRLIPGFTKKYNVTRLVYFEEHSNIDKAEKREKYLKGKTRVKKNAIVESKNPDWEDLTSKIPE